MTQTFPNPLRIKLIEDIKNFNKDKNYKFWNKIVKELSRSRRNSKGVNLWKVNRYTNEGDVVIVPKKLLGDGEITHKVTIAAFQVSESVKQKAKTNGNIRLISIYDLINENPKGSRVKIIC